jgi:hypothetical protein
MFMDLAWWIGVIGVPLVSALFAIDFYVHRNSQMEREKAIAEKDSELAALRIEKDTAVETLHVRINAINKEFNDYKVNSAMLFATVSAVREIKQELVDQLKNINNKLDRLFERHHPD